MFNIDIDTDTMTIVKKDTASFEVALENYNLDSGDTVIFTVAKTLEQEVPELQIVVEDFLGSLLKENKYHKNDWF